MWIPRDAAEVEEAARRGDLEETHTFDAKAELPQPKKNHDLAVDVAAMAVDGGVLLYGLGEDRNKRLSVLSPIVLEGARERVAQIVQTSISEPPFIRVQAFEKVDDPSVGYLLVIVPQSARAPHQVTSRDDLRFYGRGATGNRILSEGDVAGLYARREQWEANRDDLLDGEIAASPDPDPQLGYMHAYARPVAPDDGMVERVTSGESSLRELLLAGARSWGDVEPDARSGSRGYDPDFRRATSGWRRGVDGWTISTGRQDDEKPKFTARLDLDFDGTGHFFCGRVADTMQGGRLVFFESILAGNLASFLGAMGALYEAAGYAGQVDVGVAVTGIEGVVSFDLRPFFDDGFSGSTARRTVRVSAAELRDEPRDVTLALIGRLLEALRGPSYSPFAEPDQKSPA